eukprot:scaffold24393_cov112-Isochrysis_galbana.AAC.2
MTQQGQHNDIRSFAANFAFEEAATCFRSLSVRLLSLARTERGKTNQQMVSLLGLGRAEDSRRRLTELAHEMVSSALEQQQEVMKKPKPAQQKAARPNNLQDLIAEQRAYRRVGFTSEVFELQGMINEKKKDTSNDKSQEDDRLIKQRLAAMEMRQRQRSDELHSTQQAETDQLIQTQMNDYQQLLERQANEMHQLVENVTAMMTIGSGWTPSSSSESGGVVSWALALKKHRFRPSRELAAQIENVKKLSEMHAHATMLIELQAKAEELEKRERDIWRKNTMRQVLGNDRGSLASQMVHSHKVSQEKLKDHHVQKLRLLEKTHQVAVTVLEGQFRCATPVKAQHPLTG